MILPRRIYDLGLSHKAVAVYCYLANRADKNGECFPSVRRIAEDLSIHKSTVYRAFTELENRGLFNRFQPIINKEDAAAGSTKVRAKIQRQGVGREF